MGAQVLFAGDFCPRGRVEMKLKLNDFNSILGQVKPIIESTQYSIVNLECPVLDGEGKPLIKCGPHLSCTNKGIELLRWAGFKCVTIANNHILDYGEEGLNNTLLTCRNYGLDIVGGGISISDASCTLYKTIEGIRIAIVNCCEHEFSIANKTKAGAQPLNIINQYHSIREAKSVADFVFVVVHGGNEYYRLPSPRMRDTYRFFIEIGADAVINHHQHCYSGYEEFMGKPIFYGIGNFCFDGSYKNTSWNEGLFVLMNLEKEHLEYSIIPYSQCAEKPQVVLLQDEAKKSFFSEIEELNNLINDDESLNSEYQKFLNSTNDIIKDVLEPYSSRLSSALCRRGLLPSFLTKEKKTRLLAYIQCESHIPKVINFLLK